MEELKLTLAIVLISFRYMTVFTFWYKLPALILLLITLFIRLLGYLILYMIEKAEDFFHSLYWFLNRNNILDNILAFIGQIMIFVILIGVTDDNKQE